MTTPQQYLETFEALDRIAALEHNISEMGKLVHKLNEDVERCVFKLRQLQGEKK